MILGFLLVCSNANISLLDMNRFYFYKFTYRNLFELCQSIFNGKCSLIFIQQLYSRNRKNLDCACPFITYTSICHVDGVRTDLSTLSIKSLIVSNMHETLAEYVHPLCALCAHVFAKRRASLVHEQPSSQIQVLVAV